MLTKLSIVLQLPVADSGLQQTHLSLSWVQTCNSVAESLTLAILMHTDGSPVSLGQTEVGGGAEGRQHWV